MKKTNSRAALVGSLVFLACACGGDGKEPVCPTEGTSLTYNNFGRAFLTTYCSSCHAATVTGAARQNAPSGDVFDTLAQVKAKSDEVVHEVTVEKSMPYGSASKKPTDAERVQLGEWLVCGGAE